MMSNSAWSGARPHIDESELLCKTGCGYYGNPAWNGHCSKCYKELGRKKFLKKAVFDPSEIKSRVSRSVSDVSDFPSKASNIVTKKLDKRTKAVKSIFKKTHSTKASRDEKDHKTGRQLSEESVLALSEFESFFKTIPSNAEQTIRKHLFTFMAKTSKVVDHLSLDELADLVHEFYNSIHELVSSNSHFSDFSQEQLETLNELTERYVTTRLYKELNREVNAMSEEKDLIIQERIRSLNWINTSHLECKVNEKCPEVRKLLDCIISDLIEIDSKRVPFDKLRLLVSASHRVLNLLSKSSGGTPASADDFLPALIFCVIRANPPLLQSNIAYITNFAFQSSLQSGEAGYFFTNLCCAVSFIEKLTADSLGLTQAEFDRFMNGDALSLDALDPSYMSESMQLMHRNLEGLCEMESRLNMLIDSYDSIVKDLEEFEVSFVEEIDSVMKSTPMVIRSKKANIDEPDPTQELLPPPLTPQTMKSEKLGESSNNKEVDDQRTSEESNCKSSVDKSGNTSASGSAFQVSQNNQKDCSSDLREDFSLPHSDHKTIHDSESITSNLDSDLASGSSFQDVQMLDEEHLLLHDYTLKPVEGVFESAHVKWVSQFPPAKPYTEFSVQGVSIPSIPCDTALSHREPDPLSPLVESPHSSLPPPLIPTSSPNLTQSK